MKISKIYIPRWDSNLSRDEKNNIYFIFPYSGKLYKIVSRSTPKTDFTKQDSVVDLLLSGKISEIEKGYDPGSDFDNIGGFNLLDENFKKLVEYFKI